MCSSEPPSGRNASPLVLAAADGEDKGPVIAADATPSVVFLVAWCASRTATAPTGGTVGLLPALETTVGLKNAIQ